MAKTSPERKAQLREAQRRRRLKQKEQGLKSLHFEVTQPTLRAFRSYAMSMKVDYAQALEKLLFRPVGQLELFPGNQNGTPDYKEAGSPTDILVAVADAMDAARIHAGMDDQTWEDFQDAYEEALWLPGVIQS